MEEGNTPPAPAKRRNSQSHYSLDLVVVILLTVLCPSAQALAQIVAPVSASGHRLVGTVEGSAFSGAVLMDASGEQSFFRLNAILPDGSRLLKLKSESILIKQQDGAIFEVFVFRELRTAIPARPEKSFSQKPTTGNDAAPRRQRPIRHKSPMYEENGQ